MTDWDAIVGEAALGLDLAKIDLVRSARAEPAPPAGAPVAVLDRPAPPVASQHTIFRQEALEFRARGRETPGGVVRLGARWIHWTYWITLVLLAAAVTSLFLVRTDESTSGPAMVDGRTGTVTALLPAAAGPDLPHARGFTVTLPGGRSVRITGLHARLADAATIRRAGLVPPVQPAILLTGRLVGRPGPGASAAGGEPVHAQVSAVLRSESLADVLARQFAAMLGNGAAP
jgi:hypothetical protein